MTSSFNPEIGVATRWKKGQASPNPGGRPKSRLLSAALGNKLAAVKPDDPEGRTYAEIIAANLIAIASSQGRSAVAAAAEIADRLEGKAKVRLDLNDISNDLRNRPTEDLQYYLEHKCWPEDDTGADQQSHAS